MNVVKSEKGEIFTIVTACFKSFDDILKAINDNSKIISEDEFFYLSKIIPGIKSGLNAFADKVDARLASRKSEPSKYCNSSSNKPDRNRQLIHKSPVKQSKQKPPLCIQNKISFRQDKDQVIEINDDLDREISNNDSSCSELQSVSNLFSNSSDTTENYDHVTNISGNKVMPSTEFNTTRRAYRRTIFPSEKITPSKSISEGSDINVSNRWGKVRKTIFPLKITPSEKKSLVRPSSASILRPSSANISKNQIVERRISFPGRPKEKEVRFTLSPRRSSDLKLLSDSYDPSNTSWEDMARDAFKIIDLNGDGFLQKHEVIGAIEIMKKSGDMDRNANSTEMAESMLSAFDSDGDGQIDIDEFISLMKDAGKSVVNHRMSTLAHNVLLNHQRKIENSVIGRDVWMIHPLGVGHAIWDILVSTLICITVITMPLSLGWDELNTKFYEMNLVFDFIFMFDIAKNFCTGFVDENDAVIMDRKLVRWSYLTGFFLVDFLSSIPLDLIFKLAGVDGGTVSGTKRSLKLLKFVRMAKLIRLLRLNRLFQQIRNATLYLEEELHIRISDGFTKLLRLFIGALILAHWMGCFHFFLVRSYDFPLESWIVHAGLDDKEPMTQWTWSLFKALANMLMIGFETPPFTNTFCDGFSDWCAIEHWVTLGCLYLGAVFYSLLISSISSILATSSLARRRFDEKLIQIDDYMRSKRLPASLRERVKEYFHLQHSDGKLFNESEIHEMVTPFLSRQIKSFTGRDIKTRVPLFSSMANRKFTEEMVNVLEPSVAFTGDVILREDTTGDEMFFISNGVVELFFSNKGQNQPYMVIGDGCYLGEVSLLLDVRRTVSARTKTQCMLYKIAKRHLLRVLQDFPETQDMMKGVARSRKKRVDNYLDPMNNPLSPEETVDTEDAKTDIFGSNMDEVTQEKEEEYKKLRKSFESRTQSFSIKTEI